MMAYQLRIFRLDYVKVIAITIVNALAHYNAMNVMNMNLYQVVPEKEVLVAEIQSLRQQLSSLSSGPSPEPFGFDRIVATAGVIFGAFSTILAMKADRRDKIALHYQSKAA